jgi:hypothetical protein
MTSDLVVSDDQLQIGRLSITFQRTLRVPEGPDAYPLPPGLGRFPIVRVRDLVGPLPPEMLARDGLVIPMYQREALWLAFNAAEWKPNAVQVFAGLVNAVSGENWSDGLAADPQNYLVCPDQLWLDGINIGNGQIRQFIAMPLGSGYTVEAQVTGTEVAGGLQIRVYEPRPGLFPDVPPERPSLLDAASVLAPMAQSGMGLAAGGRIRQKIYPDRHGVDTWDPDPVASVWVHILNSTQFEELTGWPPPPSPVSAATYTEHGFPWFDVYDESQGTVDAAAELLAVTPVGDLDRERGTTQEESEQQVKIDPSQIHRIRPEEFG